MPLAGAGDIPVLVITTHPSLQALPSALAAAGLQPLPVHERETIARVLAETERRCVAVLDTTRPAPYSFAALYHLLHQAPAIPTLLVLPMEGAPPLGSGVVPPLDDFVRLPAQPAEIALRVQALLLRAGLPLGGSSDLTAAMAAPGVTSSTAATVEPPTAEPAVAEAISVPPGPAADLRVRDAENQVPNGSVALPPGVRLYSEAHLFVGQIDPGRRRLSDHLNDTARAYLEVTDALWCDLLSESVTLVSAGEATLRKDNLQIVVPDSAVPRSTARVPTQLVAIDLALPLFLVSGSMHRRTGDPANLRQWFMETGRQFVPVSAATISFLPNPRFDAHEVLVLVNVRQLHGWWSTG